MPDGDPKIVPARIRQLDEAAINRIAAGEVVERPASALKELLENSVDAGATRIDVVFSAGGKALLKVTDNGHGIPAGDLPLALSRHATSKIDGSDLLNIRSFGFRGEALAALAAAGRLKVTSAYEGEGAELSAQASRIGPVKPAALSRGTVVELFDLFSATPARLKFLRTDRAEAQAIGDVVRRIALAQPYVGITVRDATDGGQGRVTFRADAEHGDLFDALLARTANVLGQDFAENAVRIDTAREGYHLSGYAALPTYSRGSAVRQYLFVNGRPVRDKLLIGALRAAYRDVLSRDRHPAASLFITCDPELVDVNVHPAKTEVRFRDPGLVRGLIVSGLRHALAEAGHRASTTVGGSALGAFRTEAHFAPVYQMDRQRSFSPRPPDNASPLQMDEAPAGFEPFARVDETPLETTGLPLGAARAQLHETYIIAQTPDGLVLVDQHAAHERLVYERLKEQAEANGIAAQALLIPEVITLSADERDLLLEAANDLAPLGLTIEPFGADAVAVRETPAVLGEVDAHALVRDVLDELSDGGSGALQARIDAVLSRMSCHGSIRAGRAMRVDEMNALLRQMEATPLSGQCNHGRPTYVELKLADIERLFGRT